VSCGDTITADTKLANDLTDCPGNGIIVGAANIRALIPTGLASSP
jgi:hypothetical protein